MYSEFRAIDEKTTRDIDEQEHEFRSKFSRDRDRILYSKEFRRLSGKTQVFASGFDDNMRTRLTHTLEVSQIAETIATKLGLDTTLVEAIAYGHDVGHTPFGHAGERILNYIMNGCYPIKDFNNNLGLNQKGFKHNWQGVRVVTELEKISKDYIGLNLTKFTIWGILNHSSLGKIKCDLSKYSELETENNICSLFHNNNNCLNSSKLSYEYYDKYSKYNDSENWTFEGLIVGIADEIAQRHHDVEDGIRANLINQNELIHKFKTSFKDFMKSDLEESLNNLCNELDKELYIAKLSKTIVDFYVKSVLDNFESIFIEIKSEYNILTSEDFYAIKTKIFEDYDNKNSKGFIKNFGIAGSFENADKIFQNYLQARIINSHLAQTMDGKSTYIIKQLVKAYLTNPQQLPDSTLYRFYQNFSSDFEYNYGGKLIQEVIGDIRDNVSQEFNSNDSSKFRITLLRTVCDYISGMTDRYALDQFSLLYGPKYMRNF